MSGARPGDQLQRAFESLGAEASGDERCPPSDRLWAGARGELPAADVLQLTAHLGECGACAAAWRVAKDFGEPSRPAVAGARSAPPTWRGWLPIAAAIAIAVGGAALYRHSRTTEVVAPPPAADAPARRPPTFLLPLEKAEVQVSARYALTWRGQGDANTFLEDLARALEPYRAGQYADAARELSAVTARYPDTGEPLFYHGVSLLLGGDAEAAVAPLDRASALLQGGAQFDAVWYLAVAHERRGDRSAARAQLERVCNSGHARSAAACEAATRVNPER